MKRILHSLKLLSYLGGEKLIYLVMVFGHGAVIGHSHNGDTQIHSQRIAKGQTTEAEKRLDMSGAD